MKTNKLETGSAVALPKSDLSYKYNSHAVLDREQFNEMLIGEMRSISNGWRNVYLSKRFVKTMIDNIHKIALEENKC